MKAKTDCKVYVHEKISNEEGVPKGTRMIFQDKIPPAGWKFVEIYEGSEVGQPLTSVDAGMCKGGGESRSIG